MRKSRDSNKVNIKNKLKKAIEVPIENFKNTSRIEIIGNNEGLVEGCTGILEYDENIIRVSTKKFEVKFVGDNLNLKCLTPENIIVQGSIFSVDFIN